MSSTRGTRIAVVTLAFASWAATGCAMGKSYVVSSDYASSMNDSDWRFKHLPKAEPKPEPAATAESVEPSVVPAE